MLCVFYMLFQIKQEETIIYKDLIRIEKLSILSEKTLVGLLRSSSDQHCHIWAGLVADAYDKWLDSKELLILQNKVVKHPYLKWHCRQKKEQEDGESDRRTIPKNIRNTYKQRKKGMS